MSRVAAQLLPLSPGGAVRRAAARWIVATLGFALLAWLAGFAGLLALAGRVHDDIPQMLAIRLPLLQGRPGLIFAGESRTEYGVDPELAAQLRGQRPGFAVNIAYDAGEPLAFAAAADRFPGIFRDAEVVLSVAPFTFNEGVSSAALYPLDVLPRLPVAEQLATFLPLRLGTLIRYVREAFASRLAARRTVAVTGPLPPRGGLNLLDGAAEPWPELGRHPHYARWNIAGPKSRFAAEAMCRLAAASRRLTVVMPPWVPGDRSHDAAFVAHEREVETMLRQAGARCGFAVLAIHDVPGLSIAQFADEMHVNRSGVPIYTRYLMAQLGR